MDRELKKLFAIPQFKFDYFKYIKELNDNMNDTDKNYKTSKKIEGLFESYSYGYFNRQNHDHVGANGKITTSTLLDRKYGDIKTKYDYIDIKVGTKNLAGSIGRDSYNEFQGDYYLCIDGNLTHYYLIKRTDLKKIFGENLNRRYLGECDYGDFGVNSKGYFKSVKIS